MNLHEAQELHEHIGAALEAVDDRGLERARELAGVLVSDLLAAGPTNANSTRQRQLADEILTLNQGGFTDAPDDDACDRVMASAVELAGLVHALDGAVTLERAHELVAAETERLEREIDRVPLAAMRSIVDYNWDDEHDDYETQLRDGNDGAAENHVFLALRTVDTYLTEQGIE